MQIGTINELEINANKTTFHFIFLVNFFKKKSPIKPIKHTYRNFKKNEKKIKYKQ